MQPDAAMLTALSWSLGAVCLAVLAACAFVLVARRRAAGGGAAAGAGDRDRIDTLAAWPPEATRVLSTTERVAYLTLVRALPGHIVLAQVPVSRFVKVPRRQSYAEWLRRLGHQCVDLLVCDMASQVIAAVEIRSRQPETDAQRRRAERLARTLKAAGVPLQVWTEGALPSAELARELLVPRPSAVAAPSVVGASDGASDTTPQMRPGELASPFDDEARDSSQDEFIELREPPPSTWFDDLDSGRTPLEPQRPKR